MLLRHCVRRAASRALCTAGEMSETKTAMIEITTSSSISVKPLRTLLRKGIRHEFMSDSPALRDNNESVSTVAATRGQLESKMAFGERKDPDPTDPAPRITLGICADDGKITSARSVIQYPPKIQPNSTPT